MKLLIGQNMKPVACQHCRGFAALAQRWRGGLAGDFERGRCFVHFPFKTAARALDAVEDAFAQGIMSESDRPEIVRNAVYVLSAGERCAATSHQISHWNK